MSPRLPPPTVHVSATFSPTCTTNSQRTAWAHPASPTPLAHSPWPARLQASLDRQELRGRDDAVFDILARTVRGCVQYNAAGGIGCTGSSNQYKRDPCFKRAVDMFSGDDMESVLNEDVLALLQHT